MEAALFDLEPRADPRAYYLLNTDAGWAPNGHRRPEGSTRDAVIGALLRTRRLAAFAQIARVVSAATHNVAEYTALIEGLRLARERGVEHLRVYMDSEVVVNQMNRDSAVNEARLQEPHAEARRLADLFRSIRFSWVPREWNVEADRLAREAVGAVGLPSTPTTSHIAMNAPKAKAASTHTEEDRNKSA